MRCIICGKTIGKNDTRAYVLVYRGVRWRRIFACAACNASKFEDWIDALPTDESGRPIDPRLTNRQPSDRLVV